MGNYYRHLYGQICDWDNLWLAWRKARRGKRGQPPAATFEMDLGLLQPGQYRHVSTIVTNIGNRLGSWRNPEKEKSAQPKHRVADAGAGPG